MPIARSIMRYVQSPERTSPSISTFQRLKQRAATDTMLPMTLMAAGLLSARREAGRLVKYAEDRCAKGRGPTEPFVVAPVIRLAGSL